MNKVTDFKVGDKVYYDGRDSAVFPPKGHGTVSGFYGDGTVRVFLTKRGVEQDILPRHLTHSGI